MLFSFFTACFTFVCTNIDDVLILTILYTQVQKSKNIFQIIIGQYLGLGILIILSILGSIGTHFFPEKYIGLWGFLPLFLGLRTLILYCGKKSDEDFQHTMQIPLHIPMIMFLTLSNGADNIAVYIPLFSSCTASETTIILISFFLLIGVWCYLGYLLSTHRHLKQLILKYQNILVPFILIFLGISILLKSYF